MDEKLFLIVKYGLALLSVVVFRYLIPYVSLKLKDAKDSKLVNFIEKAINAAESIFKFAEKSGDQKKEYVTNKVKEYVKKLKINITDEQIDLLIQGVFTELDGITVNTNKTT